MGCSSTCKLERLNWFANTMDRMLWLAVIDDSLNMQDDWSFQMAVSYMWLVNINTWERHSANLFRLVLSLRDELEKLQLRFDSSPNPFSTTDGFLLEYAFNSLNPLCFPLSSMALEHGHF
jgi:hypothetical protein